MRYIYCALHFYYYFSSTSDHQALGTPDLKNLQFVSISAKSSMLCLGCAVAESTQILEGPGVYPGSYHVCCLTLAFLCLVVPYL